MSRLRPWADLVFHVLAHVPSQRPMAASVHDKVYTAFAARHLGPAANRNLGEDARALSLLLTTHEAMVAVQMLAWLFSSVEAASACAEWDLTELPASSVAQPRVLPRLLAHRQAAEILWASVLLEAEWHARLPGVQLDIPAIDRDLNDATSVAPKLSECSVSFVRALRLRGRIWQQEIWVGAPSTPLRLEADHIVWQARHEATVLEINQSARAFGTELGHTPSEQAAVVLLAERAKRSGMHRQHADWLAHLGANAPPTERSTLDSVARSVLEQILG